jgi:hypothetical protein
MQSRLRIGLVAALSVVIVLAASPAAACPICFSGRVAPPGQKIDAADVAVLARPLTPSGPYEVTKVIKGGIAEGTLVVDVSGGPRSPDTRQTSMLLVRNALSQQWFILGAVSDLRAPWLREFAAGGPQPGDRSSAAWPRTVQATPDMTDEGWRQRLALVAPELESQDQLLAEIAYGEIARAPYRLLRGLRGVRAPAEIARWVADPALAGRRPAYTLLLGISGGAAEADLIDAEIDLLRQKHETTDLAALLAADIEIGGPERVAFVEAAYFADKSRGLPEIEAALLALSVIGTGDAEILRARIVAAYRRFILARPSMAAFVVQDLTDWNVSNADDVLLAALRSGAIKDEASRFMVLNHLNGGRTARPMSQAGVGGDLPP